METANDFAAQLHRASMVSPYFFVLGDSTKNGAPIKISPSQSKSFTFSCPIGKTIRLLRMQYATYELANGKYTLGPIAKRLLRHSAKSYLNIKIVHNRSAVMTEDNTQSGLQSVNKANVNNGVIVSTEHQPGCVRLSRLIGSLAQITVEVTNNYKADLYFNGLLVGLGVDK